MRSLAVGTNEFVALTSHGVHSDGSVFYRYSDGSEYYRRKDGKIRFKYPKDTPEEAGEAGPASPPSPTMEDRTTCPWTDWPPKLHLSVETRGSSFVIRGTSGSVITFEPVGPDVKADPTPPHGGSVPPPDRSQYQPTHDPTSAVQEWLRMQTILSRGYD